jgi:glycine/D-amino acid oxidase-like deaminating enzyme
MASRYPFPFALAALLVSLPIPASPGEETNVMTCDVCMVGGGSGGFGAALAAARAGARVILVEKEPRLGGTSTSALVSNWEPGPACSFARELYDCLARNPGAVAFAGRVHRYQPDEPYGLVLPDPDAKPEYENTLRRAGVPPGEMFSVVMKPEALAAAMKSLLGEAGVTILLETTFKRAVVSDGRVSEILCEAKTGDEITIRAGVFIDSTGGAHLCRAAGCETMVGVEPKDRFDEPSAPEKGSDFLNAISLCYRIRKSENLSLPSPSTEREEEIVKTAFVFGVDETELVVNPLPLVPGATLIEKGYETTMEIARRRALAHWNWLRQYPRFRDYELVEFAPMLGIRESHRVVTDYILIEQDVRAGLHKQSHEDIVAIADHALDIHGGSHGTKELDQPYGIPYRCLIPKGKKNLLVACRGAGFSHIAASSCRLSRTMMALGHAAGLAAAEAAKDGRDVRDVDIQVLVAAMGMARHGDGP